MKGKAETAALERVVRAIDARATLRRTWPLRGGISSRMTVLEIAREDGGIRRIVLRQPDGALHENPGAVANEFKLLQRLEAAGLPTPAPLFLDESAELFDAPYLVIEYIDGAPDFAKSNGSDFVDELVSHLVEIHRTNGVRNEFGFLATYTPRFIHQKDVQYPDESLDAAYIRDVLTQGWPSRQRNQSVLLHGDYWPGNIVWKDGRIVGIVDWEEACIGDPVSDLAITRLDLLWAFGIETMHEFTDRYRSLSGFDLADLPYWDLDAALRPVFNIGEWAAGWPGLGRPDITETTMRAGHRQFVSQAFDGLSN